MSTQADEKTALINLFKSCGGESWNRKQNWCSSEPLSLWANVETDSEKVISLNLNSENLTGSIPEAIGNLTSLTVLYLNDNQLTGSIPETIGNLTSLTRLYLHENQLAGSIPEAIGNLTSLTYLTLNNNQLTGSIPEAIGNLTSLIKLYLDGNKLTGSIPEAIGNLTSLTSLSLRNNQLTGIPASIGQLAKLTELNLQNNQLSGGVGYLYLLDRFVNIDWDECCSPRVRSFIVKLKSGYRSGMMGWKEDNPLHFACMVGDYSIVSQLLSSGYDPNSLDKSGHTPLYCYCFNNISLKTGSNSKVASLLLSKGANPCIKPLNGLFSTSLEPWRIKDDMTGESIVHKLVKLGPDLHELALVNFLSYIPQAAGLASKSKQLPVEIAIESGGSLRVIGYLLEANPLSDTAIERVCLSLKYDKSRSVAGFTNPSGGSGSDGRFALSEESFRFLAKAFENKSSISTMQVHVCGYGLAGKSTLIKALQKYNSLTMKYFCGTAPAIDVLEGRTVGMEVHPIVSENVKMMFYDYGGQVMYHPNHSKFLSKANSVFIVVIPLWLYLISGNNTVTEKPASLESIKQDYEYWLRYINSVADLNAPAYIITVVNTFDKSRKQNTVPFNRVEAELLSIQRTPFWIELPSESGEMIEPLLNGPTFAQYSETKEDTASVESTKSTYSRAGLVFSQIFALDIFNDIGSVGGSLFPILTKSRDIIKSRPFAFPKYLSIVQSSLAGADPDKSRWKKVMRLADFESTLRLFLVDKLCEGANRIKLKYSELNGTQDCVNLLIELTEKRLSENGEIVLISDEASRSGSLVVTDPNWLTKELLGQLVNKFSRDKLVRPLTYEEFGQGIGDNLGINKDILRNVLITIGACVQENPDPVEGVAAEPLLHFPMFATNKMTGEQKVCTIFPGDYGNDRVILRRYSLPNAAATMFPKGYFEKLYSDIARYLNSVNKLQLFSDGMVMTTDANNGDHRVDVRVIHAEPVAGYCQSYQMELRVISLKRSTSPPSIPTFAWKCSESIRKIIMHNNSFMGNLSLQEYGINPVDSSEGLLITAQHSLQAGELNGDAGWYMYGGDENFKKTRYFDERIYKPTIVGIAEPDTTLDENQPQKDLSSFDVFLSHDWGVDGLDRDNHLRVKIINNSLKADGFKTWFDEDKMTPGGNIIDLMSNGIESSRVVIVFITKKYVDKVKCDGVGDNGNDNCRFEFMHALNKIGPKKMIPVVMEPCMKDTKTWLGPVGMTLSTALYLDMSGDPDSTAFRGNCEILIKKIR